MTSVGKDSRRAVLGMGTVFPRWAVQRRQARRPVRGRASSLVQRFADQFCTYLGRSSDAGP